ncbi:MAG: flagellar hook-associated protein FlgK [Opitutaceae bacterium]|nr:flagellar hook-associated protein FlgK [Opitutaceae bacterium]
MSGLFSELHRTSQAIAAQSQGVFVSGKNMANVNNAAYARQRVILGDRGVVQTVLGPQSLGVEALGLQQVRDKLLDSQILRETALMTSLEVQSDAFFKAEAALGQNIDRSGDATYIEGADSSGASKGIGEALDNLFNAFNGLAATPRSESQRQSLYQQAQTLVERFNIVDGRLESIQSDLTEQMSADADTVNGLLLTISDLNRQIGQYEVGEPGSALDLRDQRQAKLEELSKYVDFRTAPVAGSTSQIQILARDTGGADVVLLDGANPPTGVTFTGTGFTGGNPPVALGLLGGRLQGALTARDGAIADLRTSLDAMARQLVTSFNTAYNPGGAYSNFFDPAGTTAATIALDASLSSANVRSTVTADPGANDIALAVYGLSEVAYATGGGDAIDGTFGSYYRSVVSDLANATASAESRYDDQSTLQRLMVERRDSVSGVSIDEEMTNLIKYQRAFDASARVMRMIDEMLETVVKGLTA